MKPNETSTTRGFLRRIATLVAVTIVAPAAIWTINGADSAPATPDLSGVWAREYIGFEEPASGHGPIANRSRFPTGQSDLNQIVGDYTDPILKPAAAEMVKKRGEISLSGNNFPDPSNQCRFQPMPYILWQQEIQLLQQKNQIVILYMHDAHVRHVRLNSRHPARVKPSWSGDSVGHYEGDTLVIDTVGVKVGPLSTADLIGTPQSEAVHVIERYRLITYDTAIEAAKQGERENLRLPGDFPISDGVAVDPDYRGKGLQLQFKVEDSGVLTGPWSATSTYLRAADWAERICAENPHEYYSGKDTAIPHSDTADF